MRYLRRAIQAGCAAVSRVPGKSSGVAAHLLIVVTAVAASIAVWNAPAEAAWTTLKVVEPKTVTVQPGTKGPGSLTQEFKVNAGSTVTITCGWKQVSFAQIDTTSENAKKLAELNWQFP